MTKPSCVSAWRALWTALLLLAPGSIAMAATQPAPPLTPEQAASLDQALRLWTSTPAGGRAGASADFSVTPEGDHYRVTQSATPRSRLNLTVSGGRLTAIARPLPGGRWSFDDVRMTGPLSVTSMPGPGAAAVTLTYDAGEQTGHVLIDPSLATQSTFDIGAQALSGGVDAPRLGDVAFRGGTLTAHEVWQPVGGGRIDGLEHLQVDDISAIITGKSPKDRLDVALRELSAEATAKSLSLQRVAELLTILRDDLRPSVAPAHPAPPANATTGAPPTASASPPAPISPAERAVLRREVTGLRDLASAIEVGLTLDDLAVSANGHTVNLHQVSISQGVAAPAGRADVRLRLVVDGLASEDIPPAMAALVPRHLVIAPRLTGIPADQFFDLVLRQLGDTPMTPAETRAATLGLLRQGPASVQLDEVAFDLGPASVHAVGSLQVAGPRPADVTGSAEIDARNFEALMARAASNPLLKRSAPMLIFLKGLGTERDGVTSWHIAYAGGRLLVNGVDLSALRK